MNDNPQHKPDDDREPLREHVFDGIQEYDNRLPNWWLMTLYGTIVFSVGYWFYYHTWGVGAFVEDRLVQKQEALAAAEGAAGGDAVSSGGLIELSRDESLVEAGGRAYVSNCAACHGAELEGGVGPALANGEWVYGSDPMDIRSVILDGTAGGMPGWRQSLGERRVNEITAYILSVNPELVSGESEE